MGAGKITMRRAVKIWWSFTWRVNLVWYPVGVAYGFIGELFGIGVDSYAYHQILALVILLVAIPIGIWAMRVALTRHYAGFELALSKRKPGNDPVSESEQVTTRPAAEIMFRVGLLAGMGEIFLFGAAMMTLFIVWLLLLSFGIQIAIFTGDKLMWLFLILSIPVGIWAVRTALTDHYSSFDIVPMDRDHEVMHINASGG